MKKLIYVVNELCELECEVYNNCHGVFKSIYKAKDVAKSILEEAKSDLKENVDFGCDDDAMEVWDRVSKISININEVEYFE